MHLKNRRILLLTFLLIVFVLSTIPILLFYKDSYTSKKENNNLAEEVLDVEEKVMEENGEEKKEKVIHVDFQKLLEKNKDTVGWIIFNHEKVNYPVVRAKDNDYYLSHTFEKKRNQMGAIFMDYRNFSWLDKNVVVYGHALLDGSMFGSLKDITKSDFFDDEENHYITIIDTDNHIMKYQIFSYYAIESEEYYITTYFQNEEEFSTFLETISKRSEKNLGVEVSKDDSILTLSTCIGVGNTTKRRVIHAKRVDVKS